MTTNVSRTAPALRAPLAGVSALLVVTLFLGASLNAAKPAMGQTTRDSAAERVAVRQLTVSLARAVRHLVGSDQHKPCIQAWAGGQAAVSDAEIIRVRIEREMPPPVALLGTNLLDLPPPTLRIA